MKEENKEPTLNTSDNEEMTPNVLKEEEGKSSVDNLSLIVEGPLLEPIESVHNEN